MAVLITGGAGFIGSHLAERLVRQGEQVYVIDDLSTGSIKNIEHLKGQRGFHYHIDTIFNESLVAELVDRADVIYHLAAAVGVKLIVESPVRTIETNTHGTEVILRHASKKKKMVFIASTSEVYGKSERIPFQEDADLVMGSTSKGRWSYACSKAIDEFLGLAYYREKKVPVIVCRFFNTVGPRQTGRYGMVIPNFVQQALAQQPITVFGDGQQSRSFAHVADVTGALIGLTHASGAVGQVFNIGNNEEVTIGELAKLIKEIAKSQSEIRYIPYDEAYEEGFEDMMRRVPDIRKISQLIGYKPTHSLREIIQSVIAYHQNKESGFV